MTSAERPQLKILNTRKRQALFVAGVIAAIVMLVLSIYAILVTPQRQPYRDARAQYENVYNANIAVITAGAAVNASSATDEQFAAATERINDTLDRLDGENKALGELPVMQEGEPKAQYDAFTAKLNAYLDFNYDMITSMQTVRPVVFACTQTMSSVAESESGAEAMQECADTFGDLEDIPNTAYADLADEYETLYGEFADVLAAQAKLDDPEGADSARQEELKDEQTSILRKLDEASTAFSKTLNQQKQAVDITEAAMTLDDYLKVKSSVFKG